MPISVRSQMAHGSGGQPRRLLILSGNPARYEGFPYGGFLIFLAFYSRRFCWDGEAGWSE